MSGLEHCGGCGFHIEPEDVVETAEYSDSCLTCKLCQKEPRLKESYRRGYNAGLDAMSRAVKDIAENSGLRKRSTTLDDYEPSA